MLISITLIILLLVSCRKPGKKDGSLFAGDEFDAVSFSREQTYRDQLSFIHEAGNQETDLDLDTDTDVRSSNNLTHLTPFNLFFEKKIKPAAPAQFTA